MHLQLWNKSGSKFYKISSGFVFLWTRVVTAGNCPLAPTPPLPDSHVCYAYLVMADSYGIV